MLVLLLYMKYDVSYDSFLIKPFEKVSYSRWSLMQV